MPKVFRGYYRRFTDSTLFRPCGETQYYPVVGFWMALNKLREGYRWSTPFMGRPKFVAVRGYFVDDTARAAASRASGGARPAGVKSFYVSQLDTMRAPSERDCSPARSAGAP